MGPGLGRQYAPMKHLSPKEAWAWLQAETGRRAAQGQEPPLFVDVRKIGRAHV